MTNPRLKPAVETPGLPGGRSMARPIGIALGTASLCALLIGCSSEEPEVQRAARPAAAPVSAPPPPPAPTVTPVEELMAKYSIDERISLPENRAPDTTADRVAILEFFDAFARGDNDALKTMMSDLDGAELDAVAGTDEWTRTIGNIGEVLLETGTNSYGDRCVLAIFDVAGDYQPQLWYYKSDDDRYRFDAAATPPGIMGKLYGDDFIARWHELLQEEIELANQLDAEIETTPIVLGDATSGGSGQPSTRQPPSSPKNPGFSPGRPGKPDRRPPGKKRKPPGAR